VPLPAVGVTGAAVGAVWGLVESVWTGGWSWLGQKVARLRGGGAPVGSEDEGGRVFILQVSSRSRMLYAALLLL
jgi:hypothetical protein